MSEESFKAVLVYAAAVYGNYGNYKSFGDSKIIPGAPREDFHAIVKVKKGSSPLPPPPPPPRLLNPSP